MKNPLPSRLILTSLVVLSVWCLTPLAPGEPKPAGNSVSVVVDYNDGVQKHFTRVSWRSGMTVLDAMQAIAKHPRGIQFSHRGTGARALLYRIDDLENRANGRNWLYRVNGKLADRSFGIRKIEKGDAVLWKHEKFQ